MADLADTPSAALPDDGALLCPSCGYDLRGSASERCSECGEIFDRALLATSGFPWAHRRKIGRFRAYVKTVWLVTIGSRKLRYEAARPQELAGGRGFGRVTACIVGVLFLALGIVFREAVYDLELMAAQQSGINRPGWLDDLQVPWSAAAVLPGAVPVVLTLLGLYLGAPQRLFRVRRATEVYQERADAIAHYAAAPMAMLLLIPAALLVLYLVIWYLALVFDLYWEQFEFLFVACPLVLAATAALGTIVQVAVWAARVRHAGLISGLLAAVQLLALWLFGLIVLLGLVPWCVGFVWIVFDSLR